MKDNPYLPSQYRISSIKEFTPDTRLYKVKCKMANMPGQFVNVSLSGMGECPISICSYSSSYLELLVRNVGNITHGIFLLGKGSKLGIRGPYGKGYPMNEMQKKDIIIVAGGTGTAPPRSVIEYIQKNRKQFKKVYLYLGFKSPEDMLFKEDIQNWQREFEVILTVDHCADPNYKGKVCFVTEAVGEITQSPDNTAAVICGPPVMMKAAVDKLKAKGFKDTQMYLSFERHMKCGIGKCGHCVVSGKYICKDGPVLRYDQAKGLMD